MSRDDDGFLSRWSQRKTAARRPEAVQETTEPVAETAGPGQQEPEEAFDLAQLPSIDSLTADSDVRAFLRKGVPEVLRTAALRKMWVSDPAIRDYIGPADFQWDFNTPGALTGYGELAPGTDLVRMVADLSDYHLRPAEPVPDLPAVMPATLPEDGESEPAMPSEIQRADGPPTERGDVPVTVADERPRLRRHGGATPR